MRHRVFFATILVLVVSVTADADDGFWQRLNPFRAFRATDASPEARLEQVRSELVGRGIDPAVIDERIARMTEARENGVVGDRMHRMAGPRELPNAEEMQARLEQQGLDSAAIEERINRMNEFRENHPEAGEAVGRTSFGGRRFRGR